MWFLAACATPEPAIGCVDPTLEAWCRHDADAGGPVGDGSCPELDPDPTYGCGPYDLEVHEGGPSLFWDRDGVLVAVRYTDADDAPVYCGGTDYWYGQRVQCEIDCRYAAGISAALPLCD